MKAAFWKLFDDVGAEPGRGAVAEVRRRLAAFEQHYGTAYPAAVKCLLADVESCRPSSILIVPPPFVVIE